MLESDRAIFAAMTMIHANVCVTGVQQRDNHWQYDTMLGTFEVPRDVIRSHDMGDLVGRMVKDRQYLVKPAGLQPLRRKELVQPTGRRWRKQKV